VVLLFIVWHIRWSKMIWWVASDGIRASSTRSRLSLTHPPCSHPHASPHTPTSPLSHYASRWHHSTVAATRSPVWRWLPHHSRPLLTSTTAMHRVDAAPPSFLCTPSSPHRRGCAPVLSAAEFAPQAIAPSPRSVPPLTQNIDFPIFKKNDGVAPTNNIWAMWTRLIRRIN
jgi:hypothetical protein